MGINRDRKKAITGLEKIRKDLGYGLPDRSNVVMEYLDSLTEAIELLKEQEATVKQWTKEIGDYLLAHVPDSHDKGEKYQYKKGIWDGLQIAWNIISEGR